MQLKQGETLFKFPADAKCVQMSVDVKSELTEEEERETHSEFTATYVFQCAQPSDLQSLQLDLFKAFPLTEEIDGQLVTDHTQSGFELSPDKPSVKF